MARSREGRVTLAAAPVRRLWLALSMVFALACELACAQPIGWRPEDVLEPAYPLASQQSVRIGERYIDTLPKSEYPLAPGQRSYYTYDTDSEPPLEGRDRRAELHLKGALRVGRQGLERLCVIEAIGERPVGGAQVELTANGEALWQRRVSWMNPTGPMRPYWLPVVAGQECALVLTAGRERQAPVACTLDENVPPALFQVSSPDEPHECDYGLGLKPAWLTLVRPGGKLKIELGTARGLTGTLTAEAAWEDDGPAELLFRRDVDLTGAGRREVWWVDTSDLSPGIHRLLLTARRAGEVIARRGQDIQVCAANRNPEVFGARYANLRYPAPVYVNRAETLPWEAVWKGKQSRDIVVDFPGRPFKFVLWRGCSYVPCWALPTAWLCYEWLEAEPDYNGARGCVEPLQDKECRFSRVNIVASTPARVVVHWRYALTDLDYRIINDEWADEYFYLYPDAVGTRQLIGWISGWGWHENQEFILANRPGNRPSNALEFTALTLLSTDGRRAEATWPRPRFDATDWPDYIARVNVRDGPDPFQVSRGGPDVYMKLWYDPPVAKPGLFNSYLHWPITHGVRTTWVDDPRDYARPTHTNLMNIVNPPDEKLADRQIWSWLIGIAPPERQLIALAASWLHPGRVIPETEGLSGGEYDRYSRAYRLQARNAPPRAAFTLRPADDVPVANPAFVISDWRGAADVTVNGQTGRAKIGLERDGRDLVLFVEGRFTRDMKVLLRRRH